MRERRNNFREMNVPTRITPACAGKTYGIDSVFQKSWDHPRVCGKDNSRRKERTSWQGSPPRVRERQLLVCFLFGYTRITPACAGKTCQQKKYILISWDHPRVCGKDQPVFNHVWTLNGSPPRVRERLLWRSLFITSLRITPACAGKT